MDGCYVEILAADDSGVRIPLSGKVTNYEALVHHIGRNLPAVMWTWIEAVRIEAEDGQLFLYAVYDRACEFFGVKVLTVGQMPAFRTALALGLVR